MGFSSLSIATTALQAQQRALEVAGQNVANANTEGYTRQRVQMSAVGSTTVPAYWSRYVGAGSGVQIDGIERMNDQFLRLRSLQEHATSASLNQTKDILGRVELAFSEPSDNGIQEQLAGFWSAWDDVANNPDDLAARSALLEKTQTVTGQFQSVATALDQLKTNTIQQAAADTGVINQMAASIAQLNQTIQSAVNGGLQPNDLLDQRDNLLQKLSSMVGITIQDGANGTTDVYIGSTALVRGSKSSTLSLDTSGPVRFKWDSDNSTVAVTGGQDGGLLQAINVDLPGYRNALNAVATSFRDAVNQQHEQGVDLNSAPSATASGSDLIYPAGAGTVDAALLSVNPNLTPAQVAAAAVNGGRLDGTNALKIAELANLPNGPDVAYRQLVDKLGSDSQRASTQVSIQDSITKQTDAAVQSVSGVNLDEEMTNMMLYQHGYEAAARFLNVVGQTMDSLLNIIQ
jgi:flagellar hook-associated protein 1 FlgK